MYSVTVRGHMMIAHSLTGDVFGPAQRLHGATYVVDVEFRRSALDANGIVVDIGRATDALNTVLGGFSYRNLDEEPSLKGKNTTTEFLACHIHGLLCAALRQGKLGEGGRGVTGLKVLLRESPLAWAAFEGPVATQTGGTA